jgi:hypothetical protein
MPTTPPPGFALPEKRSWLMSALAKRIKGHNSTAEGLH